MKSRVCVHTITRDFLLKDCHAERHQGLFLNFDRDLGGCLWADFTHRFTRSVYFLLAETVHLKEILGISSMGKTERPMGSMDTLNRQILHRCALTVCLFCRNYLLESDIRSIFDQYDRDGNGYLGASDLASVYRSLGETLDDDLVRICLACMIFVSLRARVREEEKRMGVGRGFLRLSSDEDAVFLSSQEFPV